MLKEIRKPDASLAKILPPVNLRQGITYIPSQYVLSFEHEGKRYVFNNLTKQCIEGVLPTSANVSEGYDDLIKAQFLVPSDKDECAYYNQISSLMRIYGRKKGIRGYTILPTFGCNARCIYCYEEGVKQTSMTSETVEQVIRFIVDTHEGEKAKLTWFGGEPLLGEKIIDRICEGLRQAGVDYKCSMISNGSLITPEVIDKMTGDWHLHRIQISMDGAEQDYILRKHYYTDHDYYHRVMEAISLLSEAGINVSIRVNVDERNWDRIPRFLEDMKNEVTNKDNVGIYFSPLNAVRISDSEVELWAKIKDAGDLIIQAGFKCVPYIGLKLGFKGNHCMADGDGVLVCPDGSISLCEHIPSQSKFGDVWNGTTDEKTKNEFRLVGQTREKCRKCPFLPDCTSFSKCPIQENHCMEVRRMMVVDGLKRMVEKKEDMDGENPVC